MKIIQIHKILKLFLFIDKQLNHQFKLVRSEVLELIFKCFKKFFLQTCNYYKFLCIRIRIINVIKRSPKQRNGICGLGSSQSQKKKFNDRLI
ncbi:hypothetical protein pb186bvf_010013 [Paramecium bursaria]